MKMMKLKKTKSKSPHFFKVSNSAIQIKDADVKTYKKREIKE